MPCAFVFAVFPLIDTVAPETGSPASVTVTASL